MKKYTLLFFLLSLLPCLSTACSDDNGSSTLSLTVGKETVNFKSGFGSQNVAVTTNVDTWTIKSDKNWCHSSVNGKALKISVDESDERYMRKATVTVTVADQTKTTTVRQLEYEAAVLVDRPGFEIGVIGGEIQFDMTTNVEVAITLPEQITARPASRTPTTVIIPHTYMVKATGLDSQRYNNIEITEVSPAIDPDMEQAEPVSASVFITQKGLNEFAKGNGEDAKGDIKIKIVSGAASSFQSGSDIEKSFDGDYSTLYHSSWSNDAGNHFPITLTYNFETVTDVDYLIYHPHDNGNNGRFIETEIQYSADGHTFTKLTDKDFQSSAMASKIVFDQMIQAKSFRLIVKGGSGDGQGFASCAEMEFFVENPVNFDYSTLFTDASCSELKTGITKDDIAQREYPFFRSIAYYMIKGKYPAEFRISEFKAYPNPDIQSETHKTNPYSQLDSPTGVPVKVGENLIALMGDTHGHDIGLRVQNLDAPENDGFGGMTYLLNQGVNKFTISEQGLVYVMYVTKTLDDPVAAPIKIHFTLGKVNGYFDSQNPEHNGRWSELLNKATNRYFDVLGKYAHFTFETSGLRTYTGSKEDELIDLYDKTVYSEQQLLGLEKYDKMFRDRMHLNVMYHSYMYTTAYHTVCN